MARLHFCPTKKGSDKWTDGPVVDCKRCKKRIKTTRPQASIRKSGDSQKPQVW